MGGATVLGESPSGNTRHGRRRVAGRRPGPSRARQYCQRDVSHLPVTITVTVALYIARGHRGIFCFFSVLPPPLAPPLAAAVVKPPPATQTISSCSPRPCAPLGPTALAIFLPKSPHHRFLLQHRRLSITEPPHMASPLHRLLAPPSGFVVITVSSCCLSCFQFRLYCRGSPGHREPRAPCHHGR
jgi:hypothetical protein